MREKPSLVLEQGCGGVLAVMKEQVLT
jgi:hypothetical protein